MDFKVNENIFLGSQEYKKMIDFIFNLGITRNLLIDTKQFGLVDGFNLPETGAIDRKDCFYVRKAGTPFDQVIVQKGVAVDFLGNIIFNPLESNFVIPDDNQWYWLVISHSLSSKEKGTVSIDPLGNLVGVGTEFTKIFRGQPNYPTKIKFFNSTEQNVYEYEVVRVIDDTHCVLYGDFNTETNLKFSVIGTFTPGAYIPDSYKNIYQYDDSKIEMLTETVLNSVPLDLPIGGFPIARVKNNGTDVTVQDKRTQWFKTKAFDKLTEVNRLFTNPLIGVEAVKYDLQASAKDKNLIELSHGFRFASYTVDTSSKKISVLIGNGGTFKTTSDFTAGDFDNWRLYLKDGSYLTVIDSQKSGTQIVITLDSLDPNLIGVSDNLFLCPSFENIEIKCVVPGFSNSQKIFSFDVNTPICQFHLNSMSGCVLYNMVYRYRNNSEYTDWKAFPADPVGFYDENSFTANGDYKPLPQDRTLVPYVGHISNGFIKVCESPDSYNIFSALLSVGDLYGVRTLPVSNANPLIELYVERDKKYQHFVGNPVTLTADIFIVLKNTKVSGAALRNGNEFILHFEQFIELNGFKIIVAQNFVNPTSYDPVAILYDNDICYIKNNSGTTGTSTKNGLLMRCTYDETGKWIAHYDSETRPKGAVEMLTEVANGDFDNSGKGIKKPFFGWQILDMDKTFPMGTENISTIPPVNPNDTYLGQLGGANEITLDIENMPPHEHPKGFREGRHDWGTGSSEPDGVGYDEPTGIAGGYIPEGETEPVAKPFDSRPKFRAFIFINKVV